MMEAIPFDRWEDPDMSWSKHVTIWCDFCTNFFGSGEGDLVRARRAARRSHWRYIKVKDICPDCAKKFTTKGIILLPGETIEDI